MTEIAGRTGFAWGAMRSFAPLAVLLALIAVVGVSAPSFVTPQTMAVVLADTAVLFILAAGVTFVILLGAIDLSIQSVASLASVVLAQTLPRLGFWAFPLAVASGLLFGLASGLVHVKLRVPSFIATLAMGGVASGLALLASHGRAITIERAGRASSEWINQSMAGVPVVVVVSALVALAGFALLRYSPFGRYCVAIGAGEPAAWAAGVDVERTKIAAFGLSGLLAGLAGAILAARLSSGSPTLANQLLLPAIAAVIVGGTAITGGLGGVARTVVGALTISIVRIGMTFVGVNIFAEQMVFGAVLIAAVAVTIDRSKIPVIK
jgi:ribose transport system permease protein